MIGFLITLLLVGLVVGLGGLLWRQSVYNRRMYHTLDEDLERYFSQAEIKGILEAGKEEANDLCS
jgi:hypothetical protein